MKRNNGNGTTKRPARPKRDEEVFELLHAVADYSARDLTHGSFLSPSTIHKIRQGPKHGGTRFPQHLTMVEIARQAGLAYKLVRSNS